MVRRTAAVGDNRSADYNELATMDRVAQDLGAPAEAITLDYAGLSTYDSLYRAREIFGVTSLVIVTQDYHPLGPDLAEALGLAWGVAAGGGPAWAALPGTPGDPGPGQGFLLGHLPAGLEESRGFFEASPGRKRGPLWGPSSPGPTFSSFGGREPCGEEVRPPFFCSPAAHVSYARNGPPPAGRAGGVGL